MIKSFIKKRLELLIICAVVIFIAVIYCSSNAKAAEASYIEVGTEIKVQDIEKASTSEATFYVEGFKEIHRLFDIETRINTGLENGELTREATAYGTLWVTPIKSNKGRVACGATQYLSYEDTTFNLNKERKVNCHGRLNF